MQRSALVIAVGLLALAAVSATATPNLAKRALLDGKLSLLVPASFKHMSEEMLRVKYPSERRPTTVLTNPEGTVNVAVNHTQNSLRPAQLSEAHAAMDQMFRNMYPSAKWNQSEVVTINGRQFFVLDLRTPAIDTEIRNIMGGTSLDGRFLIITFNCTRELEPEWEAAGRRIIESASLPDQAVGLPNKVIQQTSNRAFQFGFGSFLASPAGVRSASEALLAAAERLIR